MKTKLTKNNYFNLLEWSLRHYSARDDLLLAIRNDNPIPLYKEWNDRFKFDVKTSTLAYQEVSNVVKSFTGCSTCGKCGKEMICGMPDPCMGRIKYVAHGCCGHDITDGYMFFSDRDLSIHFVNEKSVQFNVIPDKQSGMTVVVFMPSIERENVYEMIEDSINYPLFKKKFFTTYSAGFKNEAV